MNKSCFTEAFQVHTDMIHVQYALSLFIFVLIFSIVSVHTETCMQFAAHHIYLLNACEQNILVIATVQGMVVDTQTGSRIQQINFPIIRNGVRDPHPSTYL